MNIKERINLATESIIDYLYSRDDFSTFMVYMDEYEAAKFTLNIRHIIAKNIGISDETDAR